MHVDRLSITLDPQLGRKAAKRARHGGPRA
jgi:hypothetical protein